MGLTQERSTLAAGVRRWILISVLSVISGYVVFFGYYLSQEHRGLTGKTDIIGYPAFANFNTYALLYGYMLGLFAAVGMSLVLARYVDLRPLEETSPRFRDLLPRLPAVILASLVIAFAEVLKSHGTWYGWVTTNVLILILCKIGACAIDAKRAKEGKSAWADLSLSVMLAASVPPMLFFISQNTGWQSAPGIIVHARWFPLPILIAAEFFLLAFGSWCLTTGAGRQVFDKYFIRFLSAPALIFLLIADLPGARLLGDEFHSGEKLAPLVLGLRGLWPWRDFLFVHGIWDDFLQFYIPARLWEPTLRAGVAGTPLLFGPIYWVCFYLLFLIVFDLSLLSASIAFFTLISIYFPDPFRFLLYPIILLCLFGIFRTKRTALCALLVALCGIQVLISPEFALLTLCFGFIVLLGDLLERDARQSWAKQFRPTLVCAATTLALIPFAGWFLSSRGLLEGFLITTVDFARGHDLTGGVPVQMIDSVLWLTGLPLLFVFGSTLVFARACLRSPRVVPPILSLQWGIALCTAIYYPKYLGRPDSHIIQVLAVASPGIALFTVFLLDRAKQLLRVRYQPWVMSAAGGLSLGLVVVFGVPGIPSPNWFRYVPEAIDSFRTRFIAADQDKEFPAETSTPATAAKITALRQFFQTHLRPGDTIFDFSNSPTLFFVVLRLTPASRFTNVSMALQEEAQGEVVKDLDKNRPPYIIYRSDGGLGDWDGIPNEVRHYVIARYVNLHYLYDRTIEGSVIFRRADLPADSKDDGGAVKLSACVLGYTPNVFSPRTQPRERENAWTATPTTTSYLQLDGWAALADGNAIPEIVVTYKGVVLDRFRPLWIRPEVDKLVGRPGLKETGFSRHIELFDPAISVKDIDVSGGNDATGQLFHFAEGPLRGKIDSSTVMQAVSLLPPRGERPAYLGLEFADSSIREPQRFQITSGQSGDTTITFTKIGRDSELMLPLGGCYAWGVISKSTPLIGSAKPFTLKSAFYYYE
jgi:hypothetical protein